MDLTPTPGGKGISNDEPFRLVNSEALAKIDFQTVNIFLEKISISLTVGPLPKGKNLFTLHVFILMYDI